MPFDPDELANGLLRFMQDGREPPAGPPPAEMPGSGPSGAELQEQIKALQEQLKAINGNADVPMAPRGEPIHPLGPGDVDRIGPDDAFQYPQPVPMPDPSQRIGPDDAFKYPQPVPMPTYPRNMGELAPREQPRYGTGSPVEGLNLKVGRHGNNYSPSTVTPGKGASLN